MSDEIAVIVEMTFKEEAAAAAVDRLAALVAKAEGEDGLILYTLHTAKKEPHKVWFYERYRDKDAFKAHAVNPELNETLKALGPDMADKPQIHQLTPVQAVGI